MKKIKRRERILKDMSGNERIWLNREADFQKTEIKCFRDHWVVVCGAGKSQSSYI